MREAADSRLPWLPTVPAVVGVASRPETIQQLIHRPAPCDLVELRLDLSPLWDPASLPPKTSLYVPLLATIRTQQEGGRWAGTDEERLRLFEQWLPYVEAVDVEINAVIFEAVSARAHSLGRGVIGSFHDFNGMPDDSFLEKLIEAARDKVDVVKIAVWIEKEFDVDRLEQLVRSVKPLRVAAMGMGPLGVESRLRLAQAGSALVYGYLDEPVASGQLPAAEWVRRLSEAMPSYSERRRKSWECLNQ